MLDSPQPSSTPNPSAPQLASQQSAGQSGHQNLSSSSFRLDSRHCQDSPRNNPRPLHSTTPQSQYSPSPFCSDNRWPPILTPAVFNSPHSTSSNQQDYNMPHRVDSSERPSSRRTDDRSQYDMPNTHPTPPPIATLHQSPAITAASLTGSSISTPSPPPQGYYQAQPHPNAHTQSYQYQNPQMGARYPADAMPPPGQPISQPYQTAVGGVTTRPIRPAYVPSQSYPGQANYVIHTDDAATKLSDRVRRKCYNCRTTDTSTWRRSSLTPGKVLCNKCGLFERTHSRPRPEQFPHKRGPIVTTTFKSSRTPPPQSSGRLPPMSSQQHIPPLPPHQYDHPSIAPLISRADTQNSYASSGPEIRNLLNSPPSSTQPSSAASSSATETSGQKRPASPTDAAPASQSPRPEVRSPQYNYSRPTAASTTT